MNNPAFTSNPSAIFSQIQKSPFIVAPEVLPSIIDTLTQAQIPKFMQSFIEVLSKSIVNPSIILQHSYQVSKQQINVHPNNTTISNDIIISLLYLLERNGHYEKSGDTKEAFLSIARVIDMLLAFQPVRKRHYERIYQKILANITETFLVKPEKAMDACKCMISGLRCLKKLCTSGRSIEKKKEEENSLSELLRIPFIYFAPGPANPCMKLKCKTESKEWPFMSAYSILMWVYFSDVHEGGYPADAHSCPVLFRLKIKDSEKGFECRLNGEQLVYCILGENQTGAISADDGKAATGQAPGMVSHRDKKEMTNVLPSSIGTNNATLPGSEMKKQAKCLELGKVHFNNSWQKIFITHSAETNQLLVAMNSTNNVVVLLTISCNYPKFQSGCQLDEQNSCFCENLSNGYLATAAAYGTAISATKLLDISNKATIGGDTSNNISLSGHELQKLLTNDTTLHCLFILQAENATFNIVESSYGRKFGGVLSGHSGVVSSHSGGSIDYRDSIGNLLPIIKLLKDFMLINQNNPSILPQASACLKKLFKLMSQYNEMLKFKEKDTIFATNEHKLLLAACNMIFIKEEATSLCRALTNESIDIIFSILEGEFPLTKEFMDLVFGSLQSLGYLPASTFTHFFTKLTPIYHNNLPKKPEDLLAYLTHHIYSILHYLQLMDQQEHQLEESNNNKEKQKGAISEAGQDNASSNKSQSPMPQCSLQIPPTKYYEILIQFIISIFPLIQVESLKSILNQIICLVSTPNLSRNLLLAFSPFFQMLFTQSPMKSYKAISSLLKLNKKQPQHSYRTPPARPEKHQQKGAEDKIYSGDSLQNTSDLQKKVKLEEESINATIKMIQQIKSDIQDTTKKKDAIGEEGVIAGPLVAPSSEDINTIKVPPPPSVPTFAIKQPLTTKARAKPSKFTFANLPEIEDTQSDKKLTESEKKKDQDDEINEKFGKFDLEIQAPEESKAKFQPPKQQEPANIQDFMKTQKDEYAPPPAPKHERMKQKKFVFEDPPKNESELADTSPQLKLPSLGFRAKKETTAKPEIKKTGNLLAAKPAVAPHPKAPFMKPPKLLSLAIDTDNINKEFDIGGEKGKKIVNEEEELEKEEKEILEMAEHCVIAMERKSPQDPINSSYSKKLAQQVAPVGISTREVPEENELMVVHKMGVGKLKELSIKIQEDKREEDSKSPIEAVLIQPPQEPAQENKISPEIDKKVELIEMIYDANMSAIKANTLSLAPTESNKQPKSVNPLVKDSVLILMKITKNNQQLLTQFLQDMKKLLFQDSPQLLQIISQPLILWLMKRGQAYYKMMKHAEKAGNTIMFEQIIDLLANLLVDELIKSNSLGGFPDLYASFFKKSSDIGVASGCLKYLLGKVLSEIKTKMNESFKISLLFKACEITCSVILACNKVTKETTLNQPVAISNLSARQIPIVPYSDFELINLTLDPICSSAPISSLPNYQQLLLDCRALSSHIPSSLFRDSPLSPAFLISFLLQNVDGLKELDAILKKAINLCSLMVDIMETASLPESPSMNKTLQAQEIILVVIAQLIYSMSNPSNFILTEEYSQKIKNAINDIILYIIKVIIQKPNNSHSEKFFTSHIVMGKTIDHSIFSGHSPESANNIEDFLPKVEYDKWLESNTYLAGSLEKISGGSLEFLKEDIKRWGIKLLEKIKTQEKDSLKIEPEWNVDILDDLKKQLANQIKENNILIAIKKNRLDRKLAKTLKRITSWKGAWRDPVVFEPPIDASVGSGRSGNFEIRLPTKLSSHIFLNGNRCLMTLRRELFTYIDDIHFIKKEEKYYGKDSEISEKCKRLSLIYGNLFNLISLAKETKKSKGERPIVMAEEESSLFIPAKSIAEFYFNQMEEKLKENLILPVECELFTSLYAKKGYMLIYKKKYSMSPCLLFVQESKRKAKEQVEEDIDDEDSRFLFAGKLSHSERNLELIKIRKFKLSDIRTIVKKQIVERKSGLEIQFYSGKMLLINFMAEDRRDLLATKLVRLREKWCRSLKYNGSLDPVKAFEKLRLNELWQSWKISTFDYLLQLNNYSSRSIFNIAQYPICPWIILNTESDLINTEEDTKNYRDFSKNMGMVGKSERVEEFIRHFNQEDLSGEGHSFFNSHYNYPGIVYQFLMRLNPYFEAFLKYNSGLDDPSRIYWFSSISECLKSALTNFSDVRELIPEFYSLPEMFLNKNQIKFGERLSEEQTKNAFNHVSLPPWAKNNAYQFVSILRNAMENDIVSGALPKWIDLIFGYQQRGVEAEKAQNVFLPVATDPQRILTTLREKHQQLESAYTTAAYHFGQVPQQIFRHKHPNRKWKNPDKAYSLCDAHSMPRLYGPKPADDNRGQIIKAKLMGESANESSFILITLNGFLVEGKIEIEGGEETSSGASGNARKIPAIIGLKCTPNINFPAFDPKLGNKPPIAVLIKRRIAYTVAGGFSSGAIQLVPKEMNDSATIITLMYHKSTVTCIAIDKEERIAITGTLTGECMCFDIEDNMFWKPRSFLCEHDDAITAIYISDEMQLFLTASKDGTANLYNLSSEPKLLRSFSLGDGGNKLKIQYALLAASPLPSAIFYTPEVSTFHCYSLNGALISQATEASQNELSIISPIIARNTNFVNHLLYFRQSDCSIICRRLPNFESRVLAKRKQVSELAIFDHQIFGIIGAYDGSFSVIHDPECASFLANKSQVMLS